MPTAPMPRSSDKDLGVEEKMSDTFTPGPTPNAVRAADGKVLTVHHWRFCIRDGPYLDEDKPECNARLFSVRVIGEEVQVEIVADE